ncbi:unnamed protein product, partial [Arabidopsis halleri]
MDFQALDFIDMSYSIIYKQILVSCSHDHSTPCTKPCSNLLDILELFNIVHT